MSPPRACMPAITIERGRIGMHRLVIVDKQCPKSNRELRPIPRHGAENQTASVTIHLTEATELIDTARPPLT